MIGAGMALFSRLENEGAAVPLIRRQTHDLKRFGVFDNTTYQDPKDNRKE